jgi:integrase
MSLHPQTRRVFILRHASRRGELLGLKWQDVNFTDGTLQVRRALIEVAGQGIIEAESKTAKARRSIILPSFAVDLLKQHRTKQLETRFSSRDTTDLNGHMKLGYKRNER